MMTGVVNEFDQKLITENHALLLGSLFVYHVRYGDLTLRSPKMVVN